jgi:cytochrome c oxidase assembly protein subunit 19
VVLKISESIFLRNLMAKQDMSELGFRNVEEADTSPDMNSQLESPPNEQKENKIAV